MNNIEKLVSYLFKNNIAGFRYEIKAGPYYLFVKKHFCFNCAHKLKKETVGEIVKEEAFRKRNNSILNSQPFGNVYVARTIFKCSNCEEKYEIDDLKYLELPEEKKQKINTSLDILGIKKKKVINTIVFTFFVIIFGLVLPILFVILK